MTDNVVAQHNTVSAQYEQIYFGHDGMLKNYFYVKVTSVSTVIIKLGVKG